MAEIRLRLTENELSTISRTGAIAWLIKGMNIENAQDALRSSIRQQSDDPTASQKIMIEEKRQKLLSQINKFYETAMVITNGMELEGGEGLQQDDPELCLEEADGYNFPGINILEEDSILNLSDNADSAAEQKELELRKGQANDCLEKLHQALGDRSVVFREKLHSNKSVHHQGTRSTKELQKITLAINKHAREYRRSRAAMQQLGTDSDTLTSYQSLKADDLAVSKEVTEENRCGQGSDKLAWFWRINSATNSQKSEWMYEFYQVNWLKAKVRYDHWSEELKLVQHEMYWTVCWFQNQELMWRRRSGKSIKNGHKAYAEKQAFM
ncbi:hypothetical protein F4604DRAFT_1881800 [Suillus subluteus]|nr:hypothetical protein F4604DRAFT_1881800 [Suillus subluteus]